MDRLEFLRKPWSIETVVNGSPIDADFAGLLNDEARVIVRLLQGWTATGAVVLAEPKHVVTGGPIGGKHPGPGEWASYPIRDLEQVLLQLPGGDRPEIDRDDLLESDSGVPVASCGCGGGVGCASIDVLVSFTRASVVWTLRDRTYEFPRRNYDTALRQLLGFLGEAPDLISDREWEQPTPFRVLPI